MLDGLDTSTNEFNNIEFNANIAKFIRYHSKDSDSSSNKENITRNAPSFDSNLDRTTAQQSVRSSRVHSRLNVSYEEPHAVAEKNLSMACIERNLTSIPHEIMKKQFLLAILDLSKNKFEQLPLEILLIKPLRSLKLDHNRIKYLPSDIVKLTNLETLSISHNLLQRIPSQLSRMPRFRELNVEANHIDSITKEVAVLKNIKELNLLQNKLTSLPISFREMSGLTEFHFEWFRYANPPLDIHQKGRDGDYNLKKLKNKLNELYHKDILTISFSEFIHLFSKQSGDKQAMEKHMKTILHQACMNEDISIVRLLIRERPGLMESIDEEGLTPLSMSLINDKGKAAYYLLRNGASAFTGVSPHGFPIHIAAKRLNYGALKEIIRLGEDPNRIDAKGNTALHYAITQVGEGSSKAPLFIQHLFENGANPNAKNKENWAPMHLIARRRDCKGLKWALSYNFEVQEIHGRDEIFNVNKGGGGYKWTAMHIAGSADAPDLVMALGDAGADVFKKSATGYTPKMVVKRGGLTLKLMEKYEKEWIKKNVLFKKDAKQESLTSFNLKNLNDTREIKNASKNKFGETSFRHSALDHTRSRIEFSGPLRGSGLIFRHDDDNSLEISPETEANTDSIDETDTARDLFSEMNENPNVETEAYPATDLPFYRKASLQSQPIHNPSLKDKNSYNLFHKVEFDIDKRFTRLKTDFTLENCAREASHSKELVLSDKTNLFDKLKVLFGLEVFYFQIVDHVYSSFYGLGDKRMFPWYILQESIKRAKEQEKFRPSNSAAQEIVTYSEIIPQTLISLYVKVGILTYDSQLLKLYIIKILTDLKYFPAIDLLSIVYNDPQESYVIVREAKKAYAYLKAIVKKKDSPRGQENQGIRRSLKPLSTRVLQLRADNI